MPSVRMPVAGRNRSGRLRICVVPGQWNWEKGADKIFIKGADKDNGQSR